jgi:hypothetical protein
MSVVINGSGTITGISVGGIPDGVVDTDVLANNAVTFGKIGTTEQGQLAKAWVNFNGTGSVAIRASYNVSSITDNGTGDYTVNFATAMVDANYTAAGMVSVHAGSNEHADPKWISSSTTSLRVNALAWGGSLDATVFTVAIFR